MSLPPALISLLNFPTGAGGVPGAGIGGVGGLVPGGVGGLVPGVGGIGGIGGKMCYHWDAGIAICSRTLALAVTYNGCCRRRQKSPQCPRGLGGKEVKVCPIVSVSHWYRLLQDSHFPRWEKLIFPLGMCHRSLGLPIYVSIPRCRRSGSCSCSCQGSCQGRQVW